MSLTKAAIMSLTKAEIIEAQAKLILEQTVEICQLKEKLEKKEYDKRFTNTKHLKKLVPIAPPFNTALLDPKKLKGIKK